MPFTRYRAHEMGAVELLDEGPFVAGSHASLTLVYTAGRFGIDDTGHLKISWRTTSDMAKPQFDRPAEANYVSVEASNGAVLETRFTLANIRPYANTIFIRVVRGFLREGDRISVTLGDRRGGSPGMRLQTNCEEQFPFKVSVDAFATYEFCEVAAPTIALVPGQAVGWRAVLPTLMPVNGKFRLAIIAEDRWGNPTPNTNQHLALTASQPVAGLPATVLPDNGRVVIEGLSVPEPGDLVLSVHDANGMELSRSNPMRVTSQTLVRHFWGDLHGQSAETIGAGSAEAYFRYARDAAFVDMAGHQGNDFQMTDIFWNDLNRLTERFNEPGRFITVPGYEWSGNTGMGGDRNVFFFAEDRPIRHSSRILIPESGGVPDCFTTADLFRALAGENAVVIAHVGGRYADIRMAHDGRLERAVEVHSTWGTFEWLLHDAFDCGYRVGVVCHSDDHKGRPGATRPGASHFGAIGGLTCYLMPELSRAALFTALRQRHHYGTTGTRLFLSVTGRFAAPVLLYDEDPALGPTATSAVTLVHMGDIIRPGDQSMELEIDAIGHAPLERIDVFYGKELVHTVRSPNHDAPSRRIRVMWEGAEYRGRGREVLWRGALRIEGNQFSQAAPVNFLNPENPLEEPVAGKALTWRSVTTGNMAGIDLWMQDAHAGEILLETNHGGGRFPLADIGCDDIVLPAGGLGRRIRLFRLPEQLPYRLTLRQPVPYSGPRDLPVYARVTQADGHQAWSSPIYLIGSAEP